VINPLLLSVDPSLAAVASAYNTNLPLLTPAVTPVIALALIAAA
jgi:hypothetical protein